MLMTSISKLWSRRILIPLAILALLVISWCSGYLPVLIVMFWESLTPVVAPERPTNVPAEAVWAGHRDGGVFIDCLDAPEYPSCFDCVIYFDYSGDIWMRDIFCLDDGAISTDSLRKVFGGYNGTWISLKDGRQLLPSVDPDTMSGQEYKTWYFDQDDSGWYIETFHERRRDQESNVAGESASG